MTRSGSNQDYLPRRDESVRDDEYGLYQRPPVSFSNHTMSTTGYPHTWYYGNLPSYETDPHGYLAQYNSTYLANSNCYNPSSEDLLQTGRLFYCDRQNFNSPPVCLNHSNEQVSLPTEQWNSTFEPVNDTTYFLPGQMNLSNLSFNFPVYAHSAASSHLTPCYPPTSMVTGSLCSSPQWPQPVTPTPTPWLEPSINSYDEETTYSKEEDEQDEGENYDKPYAQLIYQCLSEAEGHRMLLRDIYDWFEKRTKKPQESGSKGWQNSIRHNLSMNKAFENDKNDPAAKGGARKANSVWVLTEHAIKNGVESTTRYRKNATSRKGGNKRIPALQRQRSGARGGRATRRATRVRLSQEIQPEITTDVASMDGSHTASYNWSPISNTQDLYSPYAYSPSTPNCDQMLNPSYSLPCHSYCGYGQQVLPKLEEEGQHFFDEEQDSIVRQMLYQSSMEDGYPDAT